MSRGYLLVILAVLFSSSDCLSQHAWNTLLYNQVSGQQQLHYDYRVDTSYLSIESNEIIFDSLSTHKRTKLTISTGGMGAYFGNSLSFDDLSYEEDNIRYIDFDLSNDKVKDSNIFGFDSQINFFHIDYRLGSGFLRGGYSFRTFGNIDFDREFFSLLADGNEPFIGRTIEIGPQLELANYHQFYLGYSGSSNGFGYTVQAKFLSGASHLKSDQSSIILTTSEDIYQLSFSNAYKLQTSKILKYNEIDDTEFQFTSFDLSKPFKGNYGFGFDIGLSYLFDDKHRLFFNAYDIGSITWTNQSRAYSSEGEINYDGLDIVDYFGSDDTVELADSLRALLEVTEELTDYSATLASQFVVGFDYQLSEVNNVSLLVASSTLAGRNQIMMSLAGRRTFSEKITGGLSYTFASGVHGIGINGMISLGKIKLVLATDHVPAIFNLNGSKMTNARAGLSLAF